MFGWTLKRIDGAAQNEEARQRRALSVAGLITGCAGSREVEHRNGGGKDTAYIMEQFWSRCCVAQLPTAW
jgi:hypothetical protein